LNWKDSFFQIFHQNKVFTKKLSQKFLSCVARFFTRCDGWGCSSCKCIFKVRGCASSCWDPLMMFCPKTLFILFIFFYRPFDINSPFLTWPSCKFLDVFWAQIIWISYKPFCCVVWFFPHFLWGIDLIITKFITLVAYSGS